MPQAQPDTYKAIEREIHRMLLLFDEENRQFTQLDERISRLLDKGGHDPQNISALLEGVRQLDTSMAAVEAELNTLFNCVVTLRRRKPDPSSIKHIQEAIRQNTKVLKESRHQLVHIQALLSFMEEIAGGEQPILPFSHKREPFWDSDPRLFLEKPPSAEGRSASWKKSLYVS